MKTNYAPQVNLLIVSVLFCFSSGTGSTQLANLYPGDVNIQNHADVIFTEMFEQNDIPSMQSNWSDFSNVSSNFSLDPSVPAGSTGTQSCRFTTINDNFPNNAAPAENTYLFRRLPQGISDSVFVRFYIKYDDVTSFHHSGVWMGGNNPANPWPGNHAGYKPAGDSAFHIGAEVRGTTLAPANSSVFGFYNYWMNMRQSTQINPNTNAGYYWGNEFLSADPNATIDMTAWNCIEVMIKLNNPVTDSTGELALWINGNPISHYGYHFPDGSWNMADFNEGAGLPFEGFQWRNNSALMFNYIWLTSYVTNNSNGHVGTVNYDHLVVAKSYIGPISGNTADINEQAGSTDLISYPNPADGSVTFSREIKNLEIYNLYGQAVMPKQQEVKSISSENLAAGIYILKADGQNIKIEIKH